MEEAKNPEEIEAARESARLWRWQQRLLPYVLGGVALLALFFFVSTFIQLGQLNRNVMVAPDTRLDATLAKIDAQAATLPPAEAVALLRWKTMVLLETDVVRHRYAQVNATLILRAWTRHVGFVTGMILTFMGALFILSKLSEARTDLGGEIQGAKATLATSSPGIVLAVLGTVLMLATLMVNFSYGTRDVPVYLPPALPPASDAALPMPAPFADEEEVPADPGEAEMPPARTTEEATHAAP